MSKAETHTTTSSGRHQKPAANIAAQIEELLRIRREAEDTVAFLIDILDERDGDPDEETDNPDLEDGGDHEPSLGSPNVRLGRVMVDGTPLWPEQEQRIDPGFDQSGWSTLSGCADLEEEHDGREPDVDDEDGHDQEGCLYEDGIAAEAHSAKAEVVS